MVEMDLAATLSGNQERIRTAMPHLSLQETAEIADYLTYLDFKTVALEQAS
jgi:hypothetical protein